MNDFVEYFCSSVKFVDSEDTLLATAKYALPSISKNSKSVAPLVWNY